MSRKFELKGIIFDYGGTIDTNSRHWAEVLLEKYQLFQVPVTKEEFREAYVSRWIIWWKKECWTATM